MFVANSGRRAGAGAGAGAFSAGSPRLSPHVDVYRSVPSAGGGDGGTSVAGGSNHQHQQHHHSGSGGNHQQYHMSEAFRVRDHPSAAGVVPGTASSGGRPVSLPLASGSGGGRRGQYQWDPHAAAMLAASRGASGPGASSRSQAPETAWLQDTERRRREVGSRGGVVDGDRGGGGGGAAGGAGREHHDRAAVASERPRSIHHLDRRHMAEEQVRR